MLLNFLVYWFFLVGVVFWLLGFPLEAATCMFLCASYALILTTQEPEGN